MSSGNKTLKTSLHAALRSALNLNDPAVAECFELPVGWSDGGCFGLAVALHAWTGGEAVPVGIFRAGEDIMDHGLVQVVLGDEGVFYLDGDGVSTEAELLHRWGWEELIGPCRVEAVSVQRLRGAAAMDPCVDAVKLLKHLRATLGSPSKWGLPMRPGPGQSALMR